MPATAPPEPERLGAFLRVGKEVGEQRERGRGEERGRHPLQRARGEEHLAGDRETGERGCRDETGGAEEEGSAVTVPVGESAAEQEQPAEGEDVGGDHPGERGCVHTELAPEHGKSDVDDRRVEHDEELCERQDAEGEPAALAS